jgi:hypothetical protein
MKPLEDPPATDDGEPERGCIDRKRSCAGGAGDRVVRTRQERLGAGVRWITAAGRMFPDLGSERHRHTGLHGERTATQET